nr:dynamin family protein [Yoonia sp.]
MTDAHPPRKPRIALMGEFSAGKSTLSNLLLGARPLPEKVTATRLAPVWMSYGDTPAYRVLVDGSTEPVSLDQLE